MANRRIGGIIFLKVEGELLSAKGNFTYNLGQDKKEMVVGEDGVHGFKQMPQVAFIEGAITDNSDLDMAAIRNLRDVTVTLELANGKIVVIEEAIEASSGNVTTQEGEAEIRFEGVRGREIST